MRQLKYEIWRVDEKSCPWHVMSCFPGERHLLERGFPDQADAGAYYKLLTGREPKYYKDMMPWNRPPQGRELFWPKDCKILLVSGIKSDPIFRGNISKNPAQKNL